MLSDSFLSTALDIPQGAITDIGMGISGLSGYSLASLHVYGVNSARQTTKFSICCEQGLLETERCIINDRGFGEHARRQLQNGSQFAYLFFKMTMIDAENVFGILHLVIEWSISHF